MTILIAGFALGISIILAVGPQNLLLIKQGVRREGVTAVILVMALSMGVFYVVGTLGVGALTENVPWLLTILKWVGVIYLVAFGIHSLKDALKPAAEIDVVEEDTPRTVPDYQAGDGGFVEGGAINSATDPETASTLVGSVATKTKRRLRPENPTPRPDWVGPFWKAMLVTWLNPGMYLDSLVVVGGVANQYGDPQRWLFTAGAFLATTLFFVVVGYGAKALSGPLSSPRVWRVLNFVIAAVLFILAVRVAQL